MVIINVPRPWWEGLGEGVDCYELANNMHYSKDGLSICCEPIIKNKLRRHSGHGERKGELLKFQKRRLLFMS